MKSRGTKNRDRTNNGIPGRDPGSVGLSKNPALGNTQEKPGLALLFCVVPLQSLDNVKYYIIKDLFVCNDRA
jgi:hypothetical protein